MRGLMSVAGALLMACAAGEPTPSPSTSVAAPATTISPSTSIARPTASSSTTPGPSVPVGIVVLARAANVPSEFRYVEGAESIPQRSLVLVNLETGVVTSVVSVSVGPSGFAAFRSSRDGRRVLVAAARPDARATISSIDVETANVRTLWQDTEFGASYALSAVLSADGARYAFADARGVLLGDGSGAEPRQLIPHVDPQMVGGTWRPLEFSPDGKWLAVGRASEGDSEVAIVEIGTGRVTPLGTGTMAAWRARAPELLVMSGRTAFGGRSSSYTYDLATNRMTALERAGTEVRRAPKWHPAEDRFLYLAAPDPMPGASAYVRGLSEPAATKVAARSDVIDAWWSRDGSGIFALVPRPDPIGGSAFGNYLAIDLASGRVIATVCRGDPRATCP